MPSGMPIPAAVKSSHTVEYNEVPNEPANIQPQTILVEAMNIPLNILFQSKSSNLNLQSEHVPSPGSTQETSSEDEPQILKHTVTKPILQTVLEIIQPYRKIIQEIKPVEETVKTIVARAMPSENKYEAVQSGGKYGSGGGGSGGSGSGGAGAGSLSMSSKYGSSSGGGSNGMGYQRQQQQQPQQQQPKMTPMNEQMLSQMMNALKMEIPKQFLQMGGYSYSPPAASSSKSRMQMYMQSQEMHGGEHSMGVMKGRQQQQESAEEEQQQQQNHMATYDQESEGDGSSELADDGGNDVKIGGSRSRTFQMELPTGSSKGESLPLELAAEPELKEEQDVQHQHQTSTTEEGVLPGEEEQEVTVTRNSATSSSSAMESSTPTSLTSEKSTGSSLPTIMIYSSAPMQQQQSQQQKKKSEKNGQKSSATTAAVPNGAAKLGLVQKSFLQSSNVEPSGY
ncbi:hypothetical protein TYRP_002589 [Tyrophagus putrescentiae]|nr:hypothetical protein TYRP_002589 [Tyrophagus putrescentiae]